MGKKKGIRHFVKGKGLSQDNVPLVRGI